jgi:hypothetical protein
MLAKWLMKIEGGDDTLCCKLLRNKYLGDNGIASYKRNNGSQFWKGLMAVRKDISRGVVYKIGNGKKARFWQDVWIGTCALRVAFPGIYEICNQQDWTVAKVMRNENLNLTFRRNFGAIQTLEWSELRTLIDGMFLTQAPDKVKWIFEKCGEFSTASLYRELTFTGIINKWMMNIWRAKLPLKIKKFLWQVCNDKVQSAEQLKKKNWPGPLECKLCGNIETAEHIFLRCALASFSWSVFKDAMGWNCPPITMNDIYNKLVEGSNRENRYFVFLFGCLAWSLWLIRNDLIFKNLVVTSPDIYIFRTISFMQKWSILHKEKGQLWINLVTLKLKHQLSLSNSEA